MIDFIPVKLYYDLYLNVFLFFSLFTLAHTYALNIDSEKNLKFINVSGYILVSILILYIGLRPLTSKYGFGDTLTYSKAFSDYLNGDGIVYKSDLGFQIFMKLISYVGNVHLFFTICAFLYVFPIYKLSKNLFKEYWYYSFLFFAISFSFWTYGVNGVRNGIATSFFLWGLCYRNNLKFMILLFFFAISIHKTVALPIVAFIITYYYNKPITYFKIWLGAIPISLVLGGVFIAVFASLGFDERLAGYLSSAAQSTRFRWDFLFHSAFAVYAGWYFIIKKGYNDSFYFRLLNTYLMCNAFWILVIKANFSNRFAYLSWFMMAVIIIYPLLKARFFENQHLMLGKIMMIYFSFTYLMHYIYYL